MTRPVEKPRETFRCSAACSIPICASGCCAIGGYDALIAGHARSRGPIVVTGNLGGFGRVDGLRREDWLDAG